MKSLNIYQTTKNICNNLCLTVEEKVLLKPISSTYEKFYLTSLAL